MSWCHSVLVLVLVLGWDEQIAQTGGTNKMQKQGEMNKTHEQEGKNETFKPGGDKKKTRMNRWRQTKRMNKKLLWTHRRTQTDRQTHTQTDGHA